MENILLSILLFLREYRLWIAMFVGIYVLISAILTVAGFYEISIPMLIVLLFVIFIPYITYAVFFILGGI